MKIFEEFIFCALLTVSAKQRYSSKVQLILKNENVLILLSLIAGTDIGDIPQLLAT